MIGTLLCAAVLGHVSASDFFPVQEGTTRTYQIKGKSGDQVVSVVGKGLDMGGATAIPITETTPGGAGVTTYYRVDADQVAVVASDPKSPMTSPMPILRVGNGRIEWDYSGKTKATSSGERLLAHGEAHEIGQRTVMGKKVDAIEVKMKSTEGIGLSAVMLDQTTVFGRGLGVIEITTKWHLGNSKKDNVEALQLVDIELGK